MSAHLPVPCPTCGGLVDRQSVKCTRCGASWASAQELYLDGLCGCSERAYKVAGAQEWDTIDAAVQGMQDVHDILRLREKYNIELDKLERIENHERKHSKAYQPFAGAYRRGA